MKRVFLAAAVLLAGIASNAQTEKGNVMIGAQLANIGGTVAKGTNNTFNLTLSPNVGWFIQDDLAIGAKVLLDAKFQKGDDPVNWGVVPFARYYFPGQGVEVVRKTRVFAEAGAGVGGSGSGGSTTTGFRGFGGVGAAYFLNTNIALETSANVGIIAGNGNTVFNPNINLGFQIHLPTKKLREMRGDIK